MFRHDIFGNKPSFGINVQYNMNREKKYVIAYNKKHFQVSHNCENRLQ